MDLRAALTSLIALTFAVGIYFFYAMRAAVIMPPTPPVIDRPAVPAPVAGAEPGSKKTDQPSSYKLKGVVREIDKETGQVMIRHEEIPGFMKAMTMLFKVDAATLQAARKGQTITARMSRQGSDWVLEDVKVVAQP